MSSAKVLIENISQLVTFEPAAKAQKFANLTHEDLGVVQNAWVYIEDGKIAEFGSSRVRPDRYDQRIDAQQGLCLPGLIDSHTHPIFAGDRSHEFCAKVEGQSYQQIAEQGGGIRLTLEMTRKASDEQLTQGLDRFLQSSLRQGVTSVEAKTGYGQNANEELRHLRILAQSSSPIHIVKTLLALHDLPKEFPSVEDYIGHYDDAFWHQAASLADYVDAFVEKGYFLPHEVEPFFIRAKALGLSVRLHCDEFSDSGAAALAAKLGAHSADHLQVASDEGIQAMADAGVVGVLLPGTSLYSGIAFTDARRFQDVALAVATDYNPGSSYCDQLGLMASLSCRYNHLPASAALAAITWVAARSLRLEKHKGAICPGWDADIAVFSHPHYRAWLGDFCYKPAAAVLIAGCVQNTRVGFAA